MVCAYLHPHATKLLNSIEELPQMKRCTVRAIILTAAGTAFAVYYKTIYSLPKLQYNQVGGQMGGREMCAPPPVTVAQGPQGLCDGTIAVCGSTNQPWLQEGCSNQPAVYKQHVLGASHLAWQYSRCCACVCLL